MSDIFLSPGARSQVREIRGFDTLLQRTQQRLTTSKKVNSVIDDASKFFSARDLNAVADNYETYIDNVDRATTVIQIAADTTTAIERLLLQAVSVVDSARASPTTRSSATSSLVSIITQVELLIDDATYLGQNLLSVTTTTTSFTYRIGGAEDANLDVTGSALLIAGAATNGSLFSSALLTGATIATALGDIISGVTGGTTTIGAGTTTAHFDSLRDIFQGAADTARTVASTYGVTVGTLEIRGQFNKSFQTENRKAAEQLVAADLNEEGANLVTLQTRRDLAIEALAAEGRNTRAVLNLLR